MMIKKFLATLTVALMVGQVPVAVYADTTDPAATVATPASDTSAPSQPGLRLVNVTQTEVDLSWAASTDDVGVAGYSLRRDGILIDTLSGSSDRYSDVNVAPGSSHIYSLSSFDAAPKR